MEDKSDKTESNAENKLPKMDAYVKSLYDTARGAVKRMATKAERVDSRMGSILNRVDTVDESKRGSVAKNRKKRPMQFALAALSHRQQTLAKREAREQAKLNAVLIAALESDTSDE